MKYARNVDGCWIDVFEAPSAAFADLADLERKLGASEFVAVDDAVKHGDFVDGENGFEPRPEPATPDVLQSDQSTQPTKAELLAKVQELVDAVSALPDGPSE